MSKNNTSSENNLDFLNKRIDASEIFASCLFCGSFGCKRGSELLAVGGEEKTEEGD